MHHKLLLVVDMQHDFIDGSLGTPQAQAIVAPVCEKIAQYQQGGGMVIFTRDTHHPDYADTQEGHNLPVEHCIQHTKGWQLHEALPAENASLWDKPSFGSPELAAHIKQLTDAVLVDEIEIIGLCTDICVVSNALLLKAFLPETPITVDARCCAGVTEESHRAALLTMQMCQIRITGADELA